VTGDGEAAYVEELHRLVREHKLADRIRFLGVIEDMPTFLRACDVACIPSVAEPFGRTAIEAFAIGTPVVATSVGGLREIVDDGETGLLVPYGDTSALAEAILRLLLNPALRTSIADRAAEKARLIYHEQSYKSTLVGMAHTLVDEDG
jgi:glycosyltransferase involved in cell wall biosynthesis